MKRLAIVHSQESLGPQEVEVLEYKDSKNLKIMTKEGIICTGTDNPITGFVYADDVYGIIEKEIPKGVMKYESLYGGSTDVTLRVEKFYGSGLPVAIQLYCDEGPFATLTKNLGDDSGNLSVISPFCAWVDINNNPEAEKFIQDNGLGEPYVRFGEPVVAFSEYCCYPLYIFNKARLEELDSKGTAEYEENYWKNVEKARKKLLKTRGGLLG